MAMRMYRVAVVGCPRAVIAPDGSFGGVGKSSLCNRFVRSEAYTESHDSLLSEEKWSQEPVYNGDHFIYWGASTKHLQDTSRVRFQIVEQTEFYKPLAGSPEEDAGTRLCAHEAREKNYITRASAVRFGSRADRKVAHRFDAEIRGRAPRTPATLRATQLFPDKDFDSKAGQGVYGFMCVFDPTLKEERMKRQVDFLSELLPSLAKTKRKVILVCTKCDIAEENGMHEGYNLADHVLKKPIPFIEVSARENVNVEDAFYSVVSPPKKHRNGKHSASVYITYKESVSEREFDINRAKDAYSKLLQQRVTDFNCVWSDVFPELEKEPEFSHILKLGGSEGKDMLKKMFCLRLMEIKLNEASKLFGHSSMRGKLDKESTRSHQIYLSEEFRKHPDLG